MPPIVRSARALISSYLSSRVAVALGAMAVVGVAAGAALSGAPQQPAGRSADNIWQVTNQRPDGVAARDNVSGQFAIVTFNKAAFDAALAVVARDSDPAAAGVMMTLPMPDSTFQRFLVKESPILADELAAAYPEIKTYSAQGIDDPTATARFGWTSAGFHSIHLSGDTGSVYIDPYTPGNTDTYIVVNKANLQRSGDAWICQVTGEHVEALHRTENSFPISHGTQLRTYRLALATTTEYTTAAGGVAQAVARIATTMNRVNGIYERELSVRMTVKTGTDDLPTALIMTGDTGTDGYSNEDGGAMLTENRTKLNAVVGLANYDIGHVFSTGGGGVAFLGSVCSATSKGGGVTGSNNPTGDAFDVDYVAHEIGHQFGGNHTYNGAPPDAASCLTRAETAAYEPASGVTIQAYAGICGTQNLQSNSIDRFHVKSLDEMTAFLTDGGGSTCGTLGPANANTPPVIAALTNHSIPLGTPFMLTGSATDSTETGLTYAWEQYDLGAETTSVAQVTSGATVGPMFRSYPASTSPQRMFPSAAYILSSSTNVPPTTYTGTAFTGGPVCAFGTCLTGETMPTTARTMNFKLTVRDNKSGGGAISTADMSVTTVASSTPFKVTSQNSAVSVTGNTLMTVTWDVSGTNAAPYNSPNVSISVSTNGGTTFSTVVASTANDGSHQFTVPNTATTTARIMVKAVENIFFDVNDANFTITAGSGGGGAPATPAAPTGTPGNQSVNLSWSAPDNGGSPITGYQVQQSTSSDGTFTNVASCPTNNTATNCNITGLTNGQAYFFKVAAINTNGQSAFSPASTGITPVAPCSYTLSADRVAVDRLLSNETITVTTTPSCAWTAAVGTNPDSMLAITAGSSVTGSGTVAFTVQPTSANRTGTLTIAGQTVTVTQSADSYTVDITVQEGSTPVAGAFVALLGTDGPRRKFGAVTTSAGLARFRGVVPGSFSMRAHSGGRAVTSGSITVSATTLSATMSMTSSSSALTSLGAYGSQTGTIVADGQTGVFYLNTTAIPSLYRTTDHGGNWSPVTLSSDDPATGLDASTTAGSPTTSGRGGEIATIVGNKVWYSFDFGLTWASMTAPTGVGNAQMYWAHIADTASTVSQLFLTSTSTASVYVADMTATTPSMSAMASSYKTNTGDLVAVGNGDSAPVIAVFDVVSGSTKFWAVDATPASTDSSITVASLSPTLSTHGSVALTPGNVTLFKIGGPATGVSVGGVRAPNTVLVYSVTSAPASNARMSTCDASSCTFPLGTTFKNADDSTSTTSTFANPATGQVSLCSANFGAVGSIAPIGGFGSVGQCWLTVNGTSLDVRGVSGINNNTGMAYDAAYDGSTNLVIISGDGQHGAAKSARMTTGSEFPTLGQNRPSFPGFPTIATAGTGTTSGGIAVQGITSAVIRQSLYQPTSATNMASVMSFTGGGRTIGSTDGGTTWFTLVDRGGSRMDWWTGATAGSQWMLLGTGGAGQWLYGTRLAAASDFATTTAMTSVVNGSASVVGPTDFGMSTSVITSPGVYGVKGITGTDYVGMGSFDGAKLRIDLARLTHSAPTVTMGTLIPLLSVTIPDPPMASDPETAAAATGTNAGSIRMAYCPSSGSASSVADALFVAMAAINTGDTSSLLKVSGLGAAIAASATSPNFTSAINGATSLTVPTGSNLRDIAVDCATGTVWLARSSQQGGGGGGTPSAGVLKSTNGGSTFAAITLPAGNAGTALQNVVAIDFNKTTTTQIVAVSRQGDVLVSDDSAGTWRLVNDTTQAACVGQTTQCGRGFGGEEPGSFAMPPATSTRPQVGGDGMPTANATVTSSGVLGSGAGLFNVVLSTSSSTSGTVTLTPTTMRFAATKNGGAATDLTSVTSGQSVSVSFSSGAPAWTVSSNVSWLSLSASGGTGSGTFTASVVNPGNVIGASTSLTGTITVTSASATNSPQTIAVTLTIDQSNGATTVAPIGGFDSPTDGSTNVVGAIAVTGWALDDIGVERVEIWRNCLTPIDSTRPGVCRNATPTGAADRVFIGTAAFVPGARSDIETAPAYAGYPQTYRAGWGYLLLTNALPNQTTGATEGGQGTVTLYAYAIDREGRYSLLGSKLVTLNNDNATVPFGAIDTPEQGGTITGALTANFGWAMTRRQNASGVDVPKCIERSRYRVFIDGVPRTLTTGTNWFPNLSRADLTAAYPGLCDSANSLAAYYIDVTALGLANGLHTIGWDVYDDNGTTGTQADDNVAGIGSRFFNILVGADAPSFDPLTAKPASRGVAADITALPVEDTRALRARVGAIEAPVVAVAGDAGGRHAVNLPQGSRLTVDLGGAVERGYLVVGDELRDLPIGSTLDGANGHFYWQPAIPYFGAFELVFVSATDRGGEARTTLEVTITDPTSGGEPEITITSPRAGANPNPVITVTGTARDPRSVSANGISAVHVWAYRKDVAGVPPQFLGDAVLTDGNYTMTTAPLQAGTYEIAVFAWVARTGTWAPAATVTIAVR